MAGVGLASPFASCEVRWFLDGDSAQHADIRHWFTECAPFPKERTVRPPEWRGRLGGKPDVYLLLPERSDMGLKWREGTLQIKGLVDELGPRTFANRHEGSVERWIKWTYEELSPAYQRIFDSDVSESLATVSVYKTRALRMFRFDGAPEPTEAPPGKIFERGMGFELTDLEVNAQPYCSVAFEAFPDDASMPAEFVSIVERLLKGLETTALNTGQTGSYPSWLRATFG